MSERVETFDSFAEAGIRLPVGAQGDLKTLCPRCSHRRKKRTERCLSVNVEKGVWHCFNDDCGWVGRLWRDEPSFSFRPATKLYVRPEPVTGDLHPAAIRWFAEREIPEAVLRSNGITATEREVIFPYEVNGEVINHKYRRYPDKQHRMDKGADVAFWNIDRVGDADSLTFAEGEFDVLAIQAATGDVAVCSVPNGVNSDLDRCFANAGDTFDRVKRVILAGDMDEPGRALMDELARRIGREKCFIVEWPKGCKDANDTLVTWGADLVADCLLAATPYPIEGVIHPASLIDRILALRQQGPRHGCDVGFPHLSDLYRVDQGQVTIVSGVPGAGKSTMLDNILINLAREHDWTFAVCSPENSPPQLYVANLIQIYTGRTIYPQTTLNGSSAPQPLSDGDVADAARWLGKHFSIIEPDPLRLPDILDLAKTLIRRDGVKGVVLDPWNRLGHNRGSKSMTEYVADQLAVIKQFASRHGVHVWVVAHPTKIRTQWDAKSSAFVTPRVRPYDISDSHAWSDMADMILIVHRDRELGETVCHVDKVRFRTHGEPGRSQFRFDTLTGRFQEL